MHSASHSNEREICFYLLQNNIFYLLSILRFSSFSSRVLSYIKFFYSFSLYEGKVAVEQRNTLNYSHSYLSTIVFAPLSCFPSLSPQKEKIVICDSWGCSRESVRITKDPTLRTWSEFHHFLTDSLGQFWEWKNLAYFRNLNGGRREFFSRERQHSPVDSCKNSPKTSKLIRKGRISAIIPPQIKATSSLIYSKDKESGDSRVFQSKRYTRQ